MVGRGTVKLDPRLQDVHRGVLCGSRLLFSRILFSRRNFEWLEFVLPRWRLLRLLLAVLVRSRWQIVAEAPTAVAAALVFLLVCMRRRNPVEQRRAAMVVDCSLSFMQRRLLVARVRQHPAVHLHQRAMQLQPLIAVVAKPL